MIMFIPVGSKDGKRENYGALGLDSRCLCRIGWVSVSRVIPMMVFDFRLGPDRAGLDRRPRDLISRVLIIFSDALCNPLLITWLRMVFILMMVIYVIQLFLLMMRVSILHLHDTKWINFIIGFLGILWLLLGCYFFFWSTPINMFHFLIWHVSFHSLSSSFLHLFWALVLVTH